MISELELAVIKRGLSQDFSILTVCLKSHYLLVRAEHIAYQFSSPNHRFVASWLPNHNEVLHHDDGSNRYHYRIRERCCCLYIPDLVSRAEYGRLNLAGTVVKSQEFLAVIQKCNV